MQARWSAPHACRCSAPPPRPRAIPASRHARRKATASHAAALSPTATAARRLPARRAPPQPSHACAHSPTQARIYDTLFKSEDPNVHEDWLADINPESLVVLQGCYANPNLARAKPGDCFQFERLG